MKTLTRLALTALLAAGAVATTVAVGCDKDNNSVIGIRSAEACTKADTIECLPKVTFMDTSNEFWTDDAMTGNVVLVNFWATWCGPCKREIPALTRAYETYKDRGVVLLGVMTDEPSDEKLTRFATQTGLRYPIVRITDELFHAFNKPESIPVTFVYDRAGNLRLTETGGLTFSELDDVIQKLLAEPPPAPAAASPAKPAKPIAAP